MRYYYADGHRRTVGPVSDRDVFRLIRDGVLQSDSPLMVEGATGWETVGTLVRRQADLASDHAQPARPVCRHCNAGLDKAASWCPNCRRSTRDHVDARLASPVKRLFAQCIDWITPSFGTAAAARLTIDAGMGTVGAVRTIAIVAWAIWSMMLFSNGMTPGKWLLGLYVIDESGDTAGFFRMLLREFIGKPLSMIVFGLGFAWVLVDKDNQGWHDKLVDTYVVED
jgi:uncharacterized RDD family membrane protein YckC